MRARGLPRLPSVVEQEHGKFERDLSDVSFVGTKTVMLTSKARRVEVLLQSRTSQVMFGFFKVR